MKSKKVCEWIHDSFHNYWTTQCNNGQYFSEGNIKSNDYKFYPYCGKVIREIK